MLIIENIRYAPTVLSGAEERGGGGGGGGQGSSLFLFFASPAFCAPAHVVQASAAQPPCPSDPPHTATELN